MIDSIRLLVLIVLPLGLVLLPPPDETQFWNSIFDVGHACVFALLGWLALDLSRDRLRATPEMRRRAGVMGMALGLGVATEFAQSFGITHSASFADVLRDVAGVAVVLLVRPSLPGPSAARQPRALRWVAGLLTIAVLVPLALTLDAYRARNRAFPVLVAFDGSRWERRFLQTGRASLIPRSGSRAVASNATGLAQLDLEPATYPGFLLNEPYPDWRGFQRLVFDIHSDATAPVTLRLRIHDRRHNGRLDDRFNRLFTIVQGTQTISIPLAEIASGPAHRPLDLSNVRGLGLYALQLKSRARLYLGPLRLE